MTPEEKQIAIAEHCGWTKIAPSAYAHLKRLSGIKPFAMRVVHHGEYIDSYSDVPDYANDLNAMHEAEKVLTEDQQRPYIRELWKLEDKSKYNDSPQWTYWPMLHATAVQRAEAFLKTIGKWAP